MTEHPATNEPPDDTEQPRDIGSGAAVEPPGEAEADTDRTGIVHNAAGRAAGAASAGADAAAAPLVSTEVGDGVITITLDSPHNRNALSSRLTAELRAAVEHAVELRPRSLVLTHAGPVFCSGADLKERSDPGADAVSVPGSTNSGSVKASSTDTGSAKSASANAPESSSPGPGVTAVVAVMEVLMDAPFVTIAAVRGPVRAGGVGLMAACDLVVVADDVTFAFTEVRIGVAPAIISVPILRRTAPGAMRTPFLTGAPFDSAEALAAGLITHRVTAADVDRVVSELCEAVQAGSPDAVAATKALLRRVPELDRSTAFAEMSALSAALFTGEDAATGMGAFARRERPTWPTQSPVWR